MDDVVTQDFGMGAIGGGTNSNGIHGGTANVGFDSIIGSGMSEPHAHRNHKPVLDVEAAYKDLNEQLAKIGRKEIERRISFGRTAARNRAILRCVTEHVGSSPSELQERLIEILTVDFMDTPITDMEIIQALR